MRRARERGQRVLRHPARASRRRRLAFAGLTDLLDEVGDEVLALLPPPQRRRSTSRSCAPRPARAEPPPGRHGAPLDPVRALVEPRPVAARRRRRAVARRSVVGCARVRTPPARRPSRRVVVSLRSHAVRPGFVPALDDARAPPAALGPLSVAALQRIIVDRLGVTFPRPMLVRIAEASSGNAFYALEIARLLADGDSGRSATAPLPGAGRPAHARRPAHRVAAGPTRVALLEPRRSRGRRRGSSTSRRSRPRSARASSPSRRTARSSSRIPLFAAAVYRTGVPRGAGAQLIGRLAEVVADPEERARHLALATAGPDDADARSRSTPRRRARERGAPGQPQPSSPSWRCA